MTKKSSTTIAIYSRKSKFTGKGESIENQIELCKQYINCHFQDTSNIIIYEDEGFSGGNTQRPQFRKMMKDAKSQSFYAIVCYRLDRISRNIGDFANLIDELSELDISFISIKEQFDTSSPMGRAMMYIASVFSQLERETIAERIRDNMRELAKTGRWLGGITPTGYSSEETTKVTIDGKTRKAYKLKLIKNEAKLIKIIFNTFIETNSLTKTETYLIQNNIKSKNANDFSRFTIRGLLENPVYMIADNDAYTYFESQGVELFSNKSDFDCEHGIMAYNKTIQKTGKAHQIRDISEWIIAVGKHKGIICGKDWIKAQKQLAQNRCKSYRKSKSNVALLSGLLYCKKCGSYMRPKLTKRKNLNGEFIYNYLCEMKEKSRGNKCNCKNPNGNEIDKLVCNEVKKLSEDKNKYLKELETSLKNIVSNTNEYDEQIDSLQQALFKKQEEINNLVSNLTQTYDTPSYSYITKKIDCLHKECEDIKNSIITLQGLINNKTLTDIQIELYRDLLSKFNNTFDKMSILEKRNILRTFINKITWDDGNIEIFFFGD